jgi:glycine cleavage system H protein
LGDVVYVELPSVGKTVSKGDEAAVVESVKAASEVYAPVSGEVVAVNNELEGSPGTINEDAAGRGWFMKIKLKDPAELDALMSEEQYQAFLKSIS